MVDLSTNGTYLNGRLVERGNRVALGDGDQIELGASSLEFHSDATHPRGNRARSTVLRPHPTPLAIVVGDIVGYTELTQRLGGAAVGAATDALFVALAELLADQRGTVRDRAGDAILGAWDLSRDAGAVDCAVRFALAAAELVAGKAQSLPMRDARGAPVRMGWAVTVGDAMIGRPRARGGALFGPAVILAFRLASEAARGALGEVLVSEEVAVAAPNAGRYGPLIELEVKGYAAPARVHLAEIG